MHFVTGAGSNNPLAPNYVPTIFPLTESPVKLFYLFTVIVTTTLTCCANITRHIAFNVLYFTTTTTTTLSCFHSPPFDSLPLFESYSIVLQLSATTNAKGSANGDRDVEEFQQCIKLQKECDKYQQENTKLRLKVISDDFLVDDVKAKYYTGLPSNELLKAVFSFVTIGLPECFKNGPCSIFQQFVMVLMKLRLTLDVKI